MLLVLPRNTIRPHAPWLPDLNRDSPHFLPQYSDTLGFPRMGKMAKDTVPETGVSETFVAHGMENFGQIRKRLKSTKQLLPILTQVPDEHNSTLIRKTKQEVGRQ